MFLVVPGILLALAGFVFTLQGLGIVGPTSSFMFQSTTWVYQGLVAFFLGVLLTLVGIWKGGRRRREASRQPAASQPSSSSPPPLP
jgi:hypothetical protein